MTGPRKVEIAGTGSYVPERVLSNLDLEKMVDTSDEWIQKRTGMRERRITAEGESNSDLAYRAGLRTLEVAGLPLSDLDAIIVASPRTRWGRETPPLSMLWLPARVLSRLFPRDGPMFLPGCSKTFSFWVQSV